MDQHPIQGTVEILLVANCKGRHTRGDYSLQQVEGTSPIVLTSHFQFQSWGLKFCPCDYSHEFGTNLDQFEFWDKSLRLACQILRVNCSSDESLQPVPSCKLFRGLVTGTSRRDQSPRVCRPLMLIKPEFDGPIRLQVTEQIAKYNL